MLDIEAKSNIFYRLVLCWDTHSIPVYSIILALFCTRSVGVPVGHSRFLYILFFLLSFALGRWVAQWDTLDSYIFYPFCSLFAQMPITLSQTVSDLHDAPKFRAFDLVPGTVSHRRHIRICTLCSYLSLSLSLSRATDGDRNRTEPNTLGELRSSLCKNTKLLCI